MKTKDKLLLFLALNTAATPLLAGTSKYEKLYDKMTKKLETGKSNDESYKLLETILNKRNKELKDLYLQNDYTIKPEYLEWQVFYNAFYNNKNRGKVDNDNSDSTYERKSRSINLGMSIPVKRVEDLNVDMEISQIFIPDIAFNPSNIREIQIKPVDLNYENEEILDVVSPRFLSASKAARITGLNFGLITNKVQYSTSGNYVFENLNVKTIGDSKGIFLISNTNTEVSGDIDYENAGYGVSGNITIPYNHTVNRNVISVNNISLDGDYTIQGNWEMTRNTDGLQNALFIGYNPSYLTKNGTVTFEGNLKLDNKNTTLTSGSLNGMILNLGTSVMKSEFLVAELINNGTITGAGINSVAMTLFAPRKGRGILNLINNGTINMEYVHKPYSYFSDLGIGINVFLPDNEDAGQGVVKTGNINLIGKKSLGVSIAHFREAYDTTIINSMVNIDGSDGIVNVKGEDNVGLYIKAYNGQIASNNGFENMKNMSILVDGYRNDGVYLNITLDSEKGKRFVADNTTFKSLSFGENSESSSLLSINDNGKLIIDKSMESVFGTINKGVRNYLIIAKGNAGGGYFGTEVINYSDINVSEGAKALTAIYIGTENTLENYGNIVNNSSESTRYGIGGVGLFIEGTGLNRGNIEMNGNYSTAIYNADILDSQSNYIKVNGNKSVAIFGNKNGYGNPSISNISLNKLEITGSESIGFHTTIGKFIISPYTEDSLKATVDGQNSTLFSSIYTNGKGNGKYTINGKVNAQIKNGAIGITYTGDKSGNRTIFINPVDLFDVSNGMLNINVDKNSYALAFLGAQINLSDLLNLDSHGINITGSKRTKVNLGKLIIDTDSDLDKNTSLGDKMYRDMEISLSSITIKDGVTISGTEDSQFGVAQNGKMIYYGNDVEPKLINEGKIVLTGKESVGGYIKRGSISNTGSIEVIGDNGVGLYGKVSEVVNKGSITIGNQGVGIYADTLSNHDEDDYSGWDSSIINAGTIIAGSGSKATGIYALENSVDNNNWSSNSITLNEGSNIDVSKSEGGIGIYTNKSKITGTGKISVGNNGFGIYAKDTDVNLSDFELNLLGDNAVGIFTDGTTSFRGNGTINVDGKGIVIFNNLSSGTFSQNFSVTSTTGSTYVFQNIKNSEIYSNGNVNLSEGGMYNYGENSAILLGKDSLLSSFNSVSNTYDSKVIGITLKGENSKGLPTTINGQSVFHEATNEGMIRFGDESSGIYVMDGASALNKGEITLGKDSIGILGTGRETNVSNLNVINISDGSVGLLLNNGGDISNAGSINGFGDKIVGLYSDTVNISRITNKGNIYLNGDKSVGVYLTGIGQQNFENTENIIIGSSSKQTDPGIGVYNNTTTGIVINRGMIKVGANSLGIYNKGGIIKQILGSIEVGQDGMGIYSDSGNIELSGGFINLTGTNGIGIYGKNNAKIDNNAVLNMPENTYGIVLNSGSELINQKSQTLSNNNIFVYSKGSSNILNEIRADITMTGSDNVGFYMSEGGKLVNKGNIIGNIGKANIGIYNKDGSIDNSGDIKIGDSVIIDPENSHANSYSVGIYGDKTLSIKNSGNIELGKAGVGVYTRRSITEALNEGNISSESDSAIGIFADNSSVKNTGTITLSGENSIGIAGERNSLVTNSGIINMNGNNNVGIYANLDTKVVNTESGIININGNNSTGIQLSSGSTLENYGQINLAAGITGSNMIEYGSGSYTPPSIINAGVIKVDEKFELDGLTLTIKVDPSTMRIPTLEEIKTGGYDYEDINSGFLISNTSSIKAPSFNLKGKTVGIDLNFTQGTNARVYKFENVFDPNTPEGGPNSGEISMESQSISFSATPILNKNSGGIDVWMEKINYTEFTKGNWNNGFAENIEGNYLNATGDRLKLYDKLDLITNASELSGKLAQLSGNIYSNMNQREQTIADIFEDSLGVLQNSKNNTKENIKINVIAGKGNVKEETSGVVNYDYTTTGVLALREVERTYKHKFGYSLGYQHTSFDFDDRNKSKELADAIQLGFHNEYRVNNWKLKNDITGRVSLYNIDRRIEWDNKDISKLDGHYETYSITSNNVLGREFSLGKDVSMTPYGGVKATYITRPSFNEKGIEGVEVKENSAWSVKSRIGVELKGSLPLDNKDNWKLKGSLDIAYEYELAGLNKGEKVKLSLLENDYHKLSKPEDEDGTLRTKAMLGVEIEERYGIFLTGEYGVGNNDKDDYRAGISLKAVF